VGLGEDAGVFACFCYILVACLVFLKREGSGYKLKILSLFRGEGEENLRLGVSLGEHGLPLSTPSSKASSFFLILLAESDPLTFRMVFLIERDPAGSIFSWGWLHLICKSAST
jgi:hypothetical protein